MLWVLDLDGVIWLAGNPIPGSPEAVRRLHDAGEQMVFVTNNSGPTVSEYVARLGRAGVDVDADELLTSSQAAASLLPPGGRAAVVGDPGIKEALDARGVAIVGRGGPSRCRRRRPQRHPRLRRAGRRGHRHPGRRPIRGDQQRRHLSHPARARTGGGRGGGVPRGRLRAKAEVAGKPNQPAADLLRARFGTPGLVVGDRPDTDGLFAAADRGALRARCCPA